MKIGDLVIILGVFVGCTALFAHWFGYEEPPAQVEVCNSMEESRLKVALAECSDAVLFCAWGDEDESR